VAAPGLTVTAALPTVPALVVSVTPLMVTVR